MNEKNKLTTAELFKLAVAGTLCRHVTCYECKELLGKIELFDEDECVFTQASKNNEVVTFVRNMLQRLDDYNADRTDITEDELLELIMNDKPE